MLLSRKCVNTEKRGNNGEFLMFGCEESMSPGTVVGALDKLLYIILKEPGSLAIISPFTVRTERCGRLESTREQISTSSRAQTTSRDDVDPGNSEWVSTATCGPRVRNRVWCSRTWARAAASPGAVALGRRTSCRPDSGQQDRAGEQRRWPLLCPVFFCWGLLRTETLEVLPRQSY